MPVSKRRGIILREVGRDEPKLGVCRVGTNTCAALICQFPNCRTMLPKETKRGKQVRYVLYLLQLAFNTVSESLCGVGLWNVCSVVRR